MNPWSNIELERKPKRKNPIGNNDWRLGPTDHWMIGSAEFWLVGWVSAMLRVRKPDISATESWCCVSNFRHEKLLRRTRSTLDLENYSLSVI